MRRAHKLGLALASYATPTDCGGAGPFLSSVALLSALLQVRLLVRRIEARGASL